MSPNLSCRKCGTWHLAPSSALIFTYRVLSMLPVECMWCCLVLCFSTWHLTVCGNSSLTSPPMSSQTPLYPIVYVTARMNLTKCRSEHIPPKVEMPQRLPSVLRKKSTAFYMILWDPPFSYQPVSLFPVTHLWPSLSCTELLLAASSQKLLPDHVLFSFFFFKFYWSFIVALQCGVSFCYTARWIY